LWVTPESPLIKNMDELDKIKDNGTEETNSQIRKKVDESWKQGVEKEKEKQAKIEPGEFVPPEPDFKFFITTLTLQASIALGHMANPATGKTEQDPVQAKFLIDTLGMLQEKTKGNLNEEEKQLLENLLYELRVAYLSKEEKK
jgi:Domain of unknown function (DUF1844)